jgi:hypothetical protein
MCGALMATTTNNDRMTKKKTAPTPKPPKRDLREMSEAEIAELEAWLIKLMKGRPME